MRTPCTPAQARLRMEVARTQLRLEIDRDSEPVTGWVGVTGGEQRQFTGYASLIAVIQALRAGDAARVGQMDWSGNDQARLS
jgi:hypothetical protein